MEPFKPVLQMSMGFMDKHEGVAIGLFFMSELVIKFCSIQKSFAASVNMVNVKSMGEA